MNTTDLKFALEHMGVQVTEDDCFRMIMDADPENIGKIQYSQFKRQVYQLNEDRQMSNDKELLDAFVAMGGQPNGDGFINADTLIKTIKKDFEMTIDIENLILQIDEDGSGEIEFGEFKSLLGEEGGNDD